MNAIIIEDEHHSAEALKTMINDYCPEINLKGIYHSVDDGVKALSKNNTQLVFLDVMLSDGTGFDLLSHFNHPHFQVVFTTAFDQYALKAIKCSALDYLLKPISLKELRIAIEKATESINSNQNGARVHHLLENINEKEKLKHLAVPTMDGFYFVEIKNIVSLKADGSYTHINLANKESLMVSRQLKEYEEMLEADYFFRVHNSYIVNINHIKQYVKGSGGYLNMSDGSTIDVAMRRKEELLRLLHIH
jgi:two-component system, LytTR family, response regulator